MNIKVGDQIPVWVMEQVSLEKMKTMAAILRDPNPVHWDRSSVKAMGMGERTINQGPTGFSYMINMLYAWVGPDSLRRLKMTFPKAIFNDERIVAKGEVTAIRPMDSETLADCKIWLERGENDHPLIGTATVKLPDDWTFQGAENLVKN